MAKRGRDLFEVLGARARGGGRDEEPEVAGPFDLWRSVVDWFRRPAGGGQRTATRVSAKPRTGGGTRLTGVALAVVVFGSLGLGFVLGRVTAGGEASAKVIRQRAPVGRPPIWLQSDADWETPLSQFAHELLKFPASQREEAVTTAAWLRGQGLLDTRLRAKKIRGTDEIWYFLVCYTDADGRTDYEKLKNIQVPADWVKLATAIESLEPPPTAYESP